MVAQDIEHINENITFDLAYVREKWKSFVVMVLNGSAS